MDAINLRSKVDLPYSIAVSGGIDSSLIASIGESSSLISLKVDELYSDENNFLTEATKRIKSPLKTLSPDTFQFPYNVIKMVRAIDYPAGTLAAYSQFLISKEVARQGYRINLGGLGADEYLSGYVRHIILMLGAGTVSSLSQFSHYRSLITKASFAEKKSSIPDRYYHLISRAGIDKRCNGSRNIIRSLFSQSSTISGGLTHVDMNISLPTLLRVDDRINMFFGIEGRSPFMDYRLIDYAMRLSDSMKLRNTGSGVFSKYILREASKNYLPSSISWRKDKIGFPSPVLGWLSGIYKHAVVNAKTFLYHSVPNLYQKLILSGENDGFSRKDWLLLQWAIWYLIFYFKMSDTEVERLIFSKAPKDNIILGNFPIIL